MSYRRLVPVLVAVLLGGIVGAPPASAHPLPRYRDYVALGDSWTADVVIAGARQGLPDTTYVPIDCAQSRLDYPHQVAAALGVKRFMDASCGSATTDDFARAQRGLPLGGTNLPQYSRLSRNTDLVTVGIGGNDAGIASAGLSCLGLLPTGRPVPGAPLTGGCKARLTAGGVDQLAEAIDATEPKVVAALRRIHQLAPKARILVVNYLALVPDHGCYPRVPAADVDMAYISGAFRRLNAMLAAAATAGGAELVDTYRSTIGHDFCQAPRVRYGEVFGLSVNSPAIGIPAHPNNAGATAQADAVLAHLRAR